MKRQTSTTTLKPNNCNMGISVEQGDRKQIILSKAAALIREKGYSGTTLRELAQKSGIKGGSIYHHFASKQDILLSIMEETMERLINRVKHSINQAQTPIEQLAQGIKTHIIFHTIEPDETYITDSELRSLTGENFKKITAMRDCYEGLYINIMHQGIALKQMDIPYMKLTVRAVLQACTGVSYWYKPDGPLSIEQIAEDYIRFFVKGVITDKHVKERRCEKIE